MNRRGFALLSVLWLVVVLMVLGASVMDYARIETQASRNRVLVRRAAWARAACVEILQVRALQEDHLVLDTIDLGRGAWCTARVATPGLGLDLNRSTAASLRAVLETDSLVAALLDWIDADTVARDGSNENEWYREMRQRLPRNGPLAAVDELYRVRAFDSSVVERIRHRVMVSDVAQMPADKATLVAEIEAGIRGSPIRSRGGVVFRRSGDRLAILIQEMG